MIEFVRPIDVLPKHIVDEVYKQAERSTLKTFKTGAVLFNSTNGEIMGKGCSHHTEDFIPTNTHTVHAEVHSLKKADWKGKGAWNMLVLSVGKQGNPAYSSKPCYSCANIMATYGVEMVYYPERLNDGSWIMNLVTPQELIELAENSDIRQEFYAKDMRL